MSLGGKGGREDARPQDKYTTQLQTNIIKVLPREIEGEKGRD